MGKVFLVTGPPASGKTTLAKYLEAQVEGCKRLSFGALLFDYFSERLPGFTYERLRRESASLITPEDVRKVDALLIKRVNSLRTSFHVIYDSHPVTKESYGFRTTTFNTQQLNELGFDGIISLNCPPQELIRRLVDNPGERSSLSEAEARTHLSLQESVATTYGVLCGCPVFTLDATLTKETIGKIAKSLIT